MKLTQVHKRILAICLLWIAQFGIVNAQNKYESNSWKETKANKQGVIKCLWYDIEPFIYRDGKGNVIGVEHDLMEGFKPFLKKKYGIDLKVDWVDANSFENIYPQIRDSKEPGMFGLSFYSITDERKKEVKFSPPYMPDLNILVTNNNLRVYETDEEFIRDIKKMSGYTMKQTTMEEDILKLKQQYFPGLPVKNQVDDYKVLERISSLKNSFGYVPVSIYVIALQRGLKLKRQRVLSTRREGFAAIYTKVSDWDEPVNEYFNSPECKALVDGLIKKYLGQEVADIILNVSSSDSLSGKPTDIELLTKEREIVTQRLIDTALEVERQKTVRNIVIIVGILVIILAGVVFNRFRIKKKLNDELNERNNLIDAQKKVIEEMNEQLKMKILQSKLNPHFLFNSLNSIQYFIGINDKKAALLYLTRFAAFLRNVLKYGDDLSITAEQEAALLEQYLWLEQCRFPGRFEYSVKLNGNGEVQTADLPPMLVHSLVEDALYLGLLNLKDDEKGKLDVAFEVVDKQLVIKVNDNGMMRKDAVAFQQSKGLEPIEGASDILQKRLELFNRRTSKKIEVVYDNSGANDSEFVNEARLVVPQPLFN